MNLNGSNIYHELPVTEWTIYDGYIQQIMKGLKNVLTKEPVKLLEPTSGTTTHTKFIPYTDGLQREFNQAIQPWLAGLYLNWPSLFFATQYWSISPATKPKGEINTKIPIGFETDSQYLGDKRSRIMDHFMAVPGWVRNLDNHEDWSYVTAFFLVRDKNLGMISIWHPSFLTIQLEKIKEFFPRIIADIQKGQISLDKTHNYRMKEPTSGRKWIPEPADLIIKSLPRRASELKMLDVSSGDFFRKLWPRLKVISCWADDEKENSLLELRKIFPDTHIQPKGIIATEGIISFPFGKISGLAAYRSHLLDFIDLRNGKLIGLNQLELNMEYEPVISTGGGLYRYRMNDLVKVTDFLWGILPQFKFLCKRDYVSDFRGEKIHLHHVYELKTAILNTWPGIRFFMIAPIVSGSKAFYCCYIFKQDHYTIQSEELIRIVDESLKNNYHYNHAREIGQLDQPRIYLLEMDPVEDIINYIESSGVKRGDIKLLPLSKLAIWHQILKGRFL